MQTATQEKQMLSPETIIENTTEEARRHRSEPLIDRYRIYEAYKQSLQFSLIWQGAYDEYDRACRNVAAALNI
jgi:hypothetical protein